MQLQVEYVDISTIKPYKGNAKEHPKEQIEQIKKSMQEFGNIDPIGIWHNEIVEGHGRYMALKELGETQIPVIRLDDLTDEQRRAYALVHNQLTMNSGFDLDALKIELDNIGEIDMSEFGFDLDLDLGEDDDLTSEKHNKLSNDFIVPPFSVLNARSGEWQDRKRYWINDVGIKSDESREDLQVSGSAVGSVPGFYDKKAKCEAKLGRKLSTKEFQDNYLADYMKDDSTVKVTNDGSLLSIFDPVLAEIMYKWFCPLGGSILDPFSGGSVRGVIASLTGHDYTGVDIRKEQVTANIEQGKHLCEKIMPKWVCGDSTHIKELVTVEHDMVFSCPPYADLEKYSKLENDISNMDYKDFIVAYRSIIKNTCELLKKDRFAVFVVGEVRDKKGKYYNFVGDTVQAFKDAGLQYYNEIILMTPIGSLPVRARRTWRTRKIGKTHQNILVFYKGDIKNIKNVFTDNSALDAIKEEKSLDI